MSRFRSTREGGLVVLYGGTRGHDVSPYGPTLFGSGCSGSWFFDLEIDCCHHDEPRCSPKNNVGAGDTTFGSNVGKQISELYLVLWITSPVRYVAHVHR